MKSIRDLIGDEDARKNTIHRIIGIERFLQLLHEEKLTLISPEKWQDPYEKALKKHTDQKCESGRSFNTYGLCWSTESRSDALWQIYSPNTLGIKVTTTVGKLADCLASAPLGTALLDRAFIGAVTYLPETTNKKTPYKWPSGSLSLGASDFGSPISTFAHAIAEVTSLDELQLRSPRMLARSFFIKRRAFRHESEIRILAFPELNNPAAWQENAADEKNTFKIRMPIQNWITQVEFDPRMKDDVFQAVRSFVAPRLPHLRGNQIKKSTLYTIPKSKGLPQ